MAEFDPNEPFEVVSAEFDPDQPYDIVKPDPISKSESLLKGVQQGTTFGFGDEIQGGVESGLDATQSLLNKLGIAGPSATQVNEQLSSEGFKGDIGPQSTLDLYRQARDKGREENAAAQEANPWSYGAGVVGGGLLTAPIMPGKLVAPLGKVAEGAGILAKSGHAVRNAAPLAGIGALGLAGGDIIDNPGQVAEETIEGTALGMGGAGIVTGGLETGKMAIQKMGNTLPKVMQNVFKRGKEGIDTTGQDFYDDVHTNVNQTVDEVSGPIIAKSKAQTEKFNARIQDLDKQISQLEAQQKAAVDLGIQKQQAQNAVDLENLKHKTVKVSEDTQKFLESSKKTLGKAFDEIDSAAEKTGVVPENRDVIDGFLENVRNNSNLPESEFNAIAKKVTTMLGKKDIGSFRDLKRVLHGYFDNANPAVKKAAKQAYGHLKSNYTNDLQEAGYNEIAERMAQTNKRWSALSGLVDSYIDDIVPDKVTGEIYGAPATLRTIGKFTDKTAENVATNRKVSDYINIVDPENAPRILNKISDIADETNKLKSFKPDVPELPNPELGRLQQLLTQVKSGPNPARVDGVDLSTDPTATKNQLTKLLPKFGMNTGDDVAENTIDGILNFLKKDQGGEFVDQLTPKLSRLSEDVQIRNAQIGDPMSVPTNVQNFARDYLVSPVLKATNVAGRATKTVGDKVDKAFNKDLLQKGVTQLADATPEALEQMGQQMSTKGEVGQRYARILLESARKNRTSKNAIMFGLMQQPEFRELMKDLMNNNVTTEDVK